MVKSAWPPRCQVMVSLVLLTLFAPALKAQVGTEVSFPSADGLEVSAYLSIAASDTAGEPPLILLFHMAGASASGEYAETVERLNSEGYSTLAVDLRSGGDRLGGNNKTAARVVGADFSYCDSYPDMVAALNWAVSNSKSEKIFAVGSSFSAALVIKLAAEHGNQLKGALAFSPASGEPMEGCRPEQFLGSLTIPLMAFRPDREMAIESVQDQARIFHENSIRYLEIENGRHGSLMLRSSVTESDMEHAWSPVLSFLNDLATAETATVAISVDGWKLEGDLVWFDTDRAQPAVLLLHGASRNRTIYESLADELASRGLASLRIDMRAHGESINLGKFQQPWADHRPLLRGTEQDVIAALAFLKEHALIDANRIGVSSASYSGEFASRAAKAGEFADAYASISPGSLSEESIQAIDNSRKPWLFVRAEVEQSFFDDIFASIEANSSAEIIVLPGDGHADRLLTKHPSLVRRLGQWFENKLALAAEN